MDKQTFLATYNLTESDLQEANISWEELSLIAEEYSKLEHSLREIGKSFIDEYLYDIETAGIHSYRYRTKGVMQLLEKVIRKKKESPEKFAKLDHTNYYKFVTDLIGIRVFFLYREDWKNFHQYLTSRFENDPALYIRDRLADFDEDPDHYYLAERPRAYKRTGDSKIYDGDEIQIISDGIYRPCIISSSIGDSILKSRAEPCSRKAGARLTTTSSTRKQRTMKCSGTTPNY